MLKESMVERGRLEVVRSLPDDQGVDYVPTTCQDQAEECDNKQMADIVVSFFQIAHPKRHFSISYTKFAPGSLSLRF